VQLPTLTGHSIFIFGKKMKRVIVFFSCLAIMYSCKKNVVELLPVQVSPQMVYSDLKDTVVRFNHAVILDIDNDGATDIYFSTLLVGDPISQQDKMQWLVTGAFDTNFPVNNNEAIPVLRVNEAITVKNPAGYTWYNASSILLAQKTLSIILPPFWIGDWTNVSHRYIAFQLIKTAGVYNAWIEISFSTGNEKLVLHKAAVCRELNRDIKAGY